MGGRGGATAAEDDEFKSTSVLSSNVRDVSKGSMPPFSESLVNRSLRLQMYPEGVTTASVRGVRPVRAQVKLWLALELDAMVVLWILAVSGEIDDDEASYNYKLSGKEKGDRSASTWQKPIGPQANTNHRPTTTTSNNHGRRRSIGRQLGRK